MLRNFAFYIMLSLVRKGFVMKKILLILALLTPFVCDAAPKKPKKEEPVVHLTDEEIYSELKKLALVFETAREKFVE